LQKLPLRARHANAKHVRLDLIGGFGLSGHAPIVATKIVKSQPTDMILLLQTCDNDSRKQTRESAVDMRELKALELPARSRIVADDGAWIVPSQSTGGTYRVLTWPGAEFCGCEDFQLRQ